MEKGGNMNKLFKYYQDNLEQKNFLSFINWVCFAWIGVTMIGVGFLYDNQYSIIFNALLWFEIICIFLVETFTYCYHFYQSE